MCVRPSVRARLRHTVVTALAAVGSAAGAARAGTAAAARGGVSHASALRATAHAAHTGAAFESSRMRRGSEKRPSTQWRTDEMRGATHHRRR